MYFLAVYIHILAGCAWIGAMLFFSLVVVPWICDPCATSIVLLFLRIAAVRYRYFAWTALGPLIIRDGSFFWGPYE